MLQRFPARFGPMILLLLLFVGLTACEDNPTGVGLDIDSFADESGDPQDHAFRADSIQAASFDDLVGNRSGILVGYSRVPETYPFRATGYIDFLSATRSDAFREGSVERAVLYLTPSYVFGDSTSQVTFELHALTEEMDVGGAENDTSITATGGRVPIASVEGATASLAGDRISFVPTDTLVAITLGQSWIDTYDEALRSEAFADDFHGFQLRPVDPAGVGAVFGTQVAETRLEVVSAEDTVSYGAGRVVSNQLATAPNFTKFEQLEAYTPAMDYLVVQDGVGSTIRFDFDLPDTLLGAASLNWATVTLAADTTLIEPPTAAFAQPALAQFYLVGVNEDGDRALLAQSSVNTEGELVFNTRTSGDLYAYLRSVLLGLTKPFDHYELAVPTSTHTVNYMVFHTGASDPTLSPTLRLTYVRND